MRAVITACKRSEVLKNMHLRLANLVRQLPSKRHVFKHDWIDYDIVFCCKSSVWWLVFKEGEGLFCCLCKKHIKTGKNVKYATAPGTRYRKAAISEHGNSEEHK